MNNDMNNNMTSNFDFLPDGIDVSPDQMPEQLPVQVPVTPKAPPAIKFDLRKAVELRLKGVTLPDIGQMFGVSKQYVWKALQPYLDNGDIDLELWKEKRADILAGKQATIMSKLTPEDIEKASPRDKAIMFAVFYDKERLERGQSTSNVSVLFQVAEAAEELQRAEYGTGGATIDAELDPE